MTNVSIEFTEEERHHLFSLWMTNNKPAEAECALCEAIYQKLRCVAPSDSAQHIAPTKEKKNER